jgi:hypothetical protein
MLPYSPRHLLHLDITFRTVHSTHRINEEYRNCPEGNIFEAADGVSVVTWTRSTAAAATGATVLSGTNLHFNLLAVVVFHQSNFVVNKRLVILDTVQ